MRIHDHDFIAELKRDAHLESTVCMQRQVYLEGDLGLSERLAGRRSPSRSAKGARSQRSLLDPGINQQTFNRLFTSTICSLTDEWPPGDLST